MKESERTPQFKPFWVYKAPIPTFGTSGSRVQPLFCSSFSPGFTDPIADARCVRTEHRAGRVMVTTPTCPRTRRNYAGVEAATTEPAACEQHASFVHPSVQREGRTAMASSSHARLERVNAENALLMVPELLRFHPPNAGYDTWFARITQLVTTAGEAQTPSGSLRHPPSRDEKEAQGASLPALVSGDQAKPRCGTTHLANHHRVPRKETTAKLSSAWLR